MTEKQSFFPSLQNLFSCLLIEILFHEELLRVPAAVCFLFVTELIRFVEETRC